MFEDAKDQALYESIMNGLRQQGWDRIEADNEAYDRVDRMIETRKLNDEARTVEY